MFLHINCNIWRLFSAVKIKNITGKNLILFGEAVLSSTHNLCFGAKIRKIGIALHTPVFHVFLMVRNLYFFLTEVMLQKFESDI